jgi:hypothetical protein
LFFQQQKTPVSGGLSCQLPNRSRIPRVRQVRLLRQPVSTLMTTAINRSYDLANWSELSSKLEKATEKMTDTQRRLIINALDNVGGTTVSGLIQVPTNDTRRMYTFQELFDSVKNELGQQRIMDSAVDDILFGTDGLIFRAGGGRADHLMEDIEVAYIEKPSKGITVGPIITSGRNRLMALQILLKSASPEALINQVKIRCSTISLPDRDSVERRIVAANMGSRSMAQAEIRERKAGGKGLNTSSREALIESLEGASSNKVYAPAFGALVRLCATTKNLPLLSVDQFAASGVSVYNALVKANKDLNSRVDTDTDLLVKLADCACENIQAALPEVEANRARGAKSHKLARILTRKVAERYQLSVIA